jgi:four helix bundle protein
MQYKQFEDLPVWRKAVELAVRIHGLGSNGCLKGYSGLRDQIERAALSVSNNIAEDFERGTRDELIAFLYIAKGSAGEVRSMLHVCRDLHVGDDRIVEISAAHDLVLEISRQLGAWVESLKNSDALNPRERNEAARQAAREVKRREAFLKQLQRIAKGKDTVDGGEPKQPL